MEELIFDGETAIMAKVRNLREEDFQGVCELLRELDRLFRSHHRITEDGTRRIFLQMQAQPKVYRNFVAESEGRIVGFLSMVLYRTFFHAGGTALINELVVADGFQGRGIGRSLVKQAVGTADDLGMNEVEVATTFENTNAVAFYKKCGLTDESLLLGTELECMSASGLRQD